MTHRKQKTIQTQLLHAGTAPFEQKGFVNAPVSRGSTVLYANAQDYRDFKNDFYYARCGHPSMKALEDALKEIEKADEVMICPSGLNAITTALLSLLQSGDHLLMVESAYGCAREFATHVLPRFGISCTFYAPRTHAKDLKKLIQPNTKMLYMESPGSLTMEMQDVTALVVLAKTHGLLTLIDNTWAMPLHFNALDAGVDVSMISASKFYGGHADVVMGTLAARGDLAKQLRKGWLDLGVSVASDDCYLVLRGLRSLPARLAQHQSTLSKVLEYLEAQHWVHNIMCPAWQNSPDYALWKANYKGAAALVSIELKDYSNATVNAFLDGLELFGIGVSWGGFESLAVPFDVKTHRTLGELPQNPCIRFALGLENAQDLIDDLTQAARVFN